jgi:hypothetical protein
MKMESSMKWQALTRKWAYWKDDYAHLQIETGSRGLAWFGISELITGDHGMHEESSSLFDLAPNIEKIVDEKSLAAAYAAAIRTVIGHWKKEVISDREAAFLSAFIQWGVLENTIAKLPNSLRKKIALYRKLESEIPELQRAPGLLEAAPVNQPLLIMPSKTSLRYTTCGQRSYTSWGSITRN